MAEERNTSNVQPLTLDQLIDQITERLNSQKRINKSKEDIESVVTKFVKYLNYFNSLNQFNKSCFDEIIDLSEIIILNEYKDLIYPASIKRIAGSYLCDDVLIRTEAPKLDNDYSCNLSDYMTCINTIRSLTKRDAFSDYCKLSDLKLEVSIDSVINKASYNSKVRVMNDWFYPIPLNIDNGYNSMYFNTSSEECAKSYFSLLKLN